jgi:membrane protease YdiL (CAAX protease family)
MEAKKFMSRIVLFYLFSWFFLMLLGGIQQESGLIPPEIGIAQWGPGLAGILMYYIFRKDGSRFTFYQKDTPRFRYVLAAVIPAGMGVVVYFLYSLLINERSLSPEVYESLLLVILWTPLGALGEEIGWRGYLHKKLNSKMSGLVSSLLVGLLWMPIHIHFLGEGFLFVVFLTLLLISYSIVIYILVQDIGFSVLVATIFHMSVNLSNLLFLEVIQETRFMVINGMIWTVLAGTIVLIKKKAFMRPQT